MKIMKKSLVLLLCIFTFTVNIINSFALTDKEKSNISTSVQIYEISSEIIDSLASIGFDYSKINSILSLEPKNETFYINQNYNVSKTSLNTSYPIQLAEYREKMKNQRVFDGNTPKTAQEQSERMKLITNKGLKTYGYLSSARFDDYIYYLYMAHFVDNEQYNPERPNFDAILTDYLCQDDITVYNLFEQRLYGQEVVTSTKKVTEYFINLDSALDTITEFDLKRATTFDVLNGLKALSDTLNIPIDEINNLYKIAFGYYSSATDTIDLVNKIYNDVSFEGLPMSLATSLANSVVDLGSVLITGGFNLLAPMVNIMDFYGDLYNVASLAALSYSWHVRIAIRTAIYVGMTPRPE